MLTAVQPFTTQSVASPSNSSDGSDPVFALIAAHKQAGEKFEGLVSETPEFDAAVDEEWRIWGDLVRTVPQTWAGFCELLRYAAAYPDLEFSGTAEEAIYSLAAALPRLTANS